MVSKALVVGSGAIGLRTAIELLKKNIRVHLQSSHHPLHPSTASSGAGGLWMPFRCDDTRVNRWAIETLDELLALAHRKSDPKSSSVEVTPAVMFLHKNYLEYDDGKPNEGLPEWTRDGRLSFQAMTVEMLLWQNAVHKLRLPKEEDIEMAGYPYCWHFRTPIVDCPTMLQDMLEEVKQHPLTETVQTDRSEFTSLGDMAEEASQLGCDALVNCTGHGAKQICEDDALVGGRGVLLQYDRTSQKKIDVNDAVIFTEEEPWGSAEEPCYLIPRGDTLVVGGSYSEGDTESGMRPEERERLLKNAKLLGINGDDAVPIGEWTGFRPCRRPMVRLEEDDGIGYDHPNVKVVHNYGHGGSGWTVFVGAAKEVARLLKPGPKL